MCAIPECHNPCHVDEEGTVHECCCYTHAMEHQRRVAIQQQTNQQIVKGVTHCLLPGCSIPAWPFENYCGRRHANIGKRQGLERESPVMSMDLPVGTHHFKIVPEGCLRPESQRAEQASADKLEDQCELPGCTKPKPEGVHHYCCREHSDEDYPNLARILINDDTVEDFLKNFTNLKVDSLDENVHAVAPGGKLFRRFKSRMFSLPKDERQTCLAFHGTPQQNIPSIRRKGYDPKRRRREKYGKGDYFATTPDTAMMYCKGRKMLLNELLLGEEGIDHTRAQNNIVVMKDPARSLPRYVITFQK